MARKNAGVTLQQLSKQSLLSASMLSKIENGQISASLKTIQVICHALNISITSLFRQHDKDVEPTFIKSGNGLTIERAGSDESRHYQLLGHTVGGSLKVEPCLITIKSRDYEFPEFQHKGVEFIYMLKGQMDYFYGNKVYHFKKGDSLLNYSVPFCDQKNILRQNGRTKIKNTLGHYLCFHNFSFIGTLFYFCSRARRFWHPSSS